MTFLGLVGVSWVLGPFLSGPVALKERRWIGASRWQLVTPCARSAVADPSVAFASSQGEVVLENHYILKENGNGNSASKFPKEFFSM